MRTYNSQKQLKLSNFYLPFEGSLDPNNRWVLLGDRLPWDDLVQPYLKALNEEKGRPSIDARIVVGAIILKHLLNVSDREVIAQISENIYLQYFLGLEGFCKEAIFDPSLFVSLRKRLGQESFEEMTKALVEKVNAEEERKDEKKELKSDKEEKRKGKLIVDATVSPSDITYPTDLNLLGKARELTEEIIDIFWKNDRSSFDKKPRDYRKQARKRYLNAAKKKKPSRKALRKAIGQQLRYLKRNLKRIDMWLDKKSCLLKTLPKWLYKRLLVLRLVYEQQGEMYNKKKNRCNDRVVSLSQPYVRPIVRGKAGNKVEFGAKLNCSLVDGMVWIDNLDFDNFNEGICLKEEVENYKMRYGYYPEQVLGDKIYATSSNLKWLKGKNIYFTGKSLKKMKNERNRIEGKFGEGKRKNGLDKIKAKREDTSYSWIASILFCMNIKCFMKGSILLIVFILIMFFLVNVRRKNTIVDVKRPMKFAF